MHPPERLASAAEAAPPVALDAVIWNKPLPPLDVALVGGGSVRLGGPRDGVLVVDFWATWCAPCRQELPHLQALWKAERDRGLSVVAVNVLEPTETAVAYWDDLGLELPIGIFVPAMQPDLYKEILPTTLVADRWGRLRGRWDGYEPGYERALAALVRQLLAEPSPPSRTVLSLHAGAGLVSVSATREVPGRIDDLAVIPTRDGPPSIEVSIGRTRTTFDASGPTIRTEHAPIAFGVARAAAGHVANFRPGGSTLELRSAANGESLTVDLGGPVFDAAWHVIAGNARLVVAGTGGVWSIDDVTPTPRRLEGVPAASSVAAAGDGLIALGLDGRLRWLDPALGVLRETVAPAGAWRVTAADGASDDAIVASETIVGIARGRFLPGDGEQIAAATSSGTLVLVDALTGGLRLRGTRDRIAAIAAADLDGDGRSELVVAGEREWFVLSAREASLDAERPRP